MMNPSANGRARRLLAREAAGPADTTNILPAAERVLRRLHEHLGRWFGADGIQSILARAQAQTRTNHPVLIDVRISLDGPLRLEGVAEQTQSQIQPELAEALTALVAATIAVLERMVGEDLVARLLHQIWPDEMPGESRATTGGAATDDPRPREDKTR